MHSEHSDLLRDSERPSDSELLPALRATPSGGRPRTPSYSELLQGTPSCCSEPVKLSEPHQARSSWGHIPSTALSPSYSEWGAPKNSERLRALRALRATPKHSELLPSTQSYSQTPEHSELLRVGAPENSELLKANPSCSEHSEHSELLRALPETPSYSEPIRAAPSTPSTPTLSGKGRVVPAPHTRPLLGLFATIAQNSLLRASQ